MRRLAAALSEAIRAEGIRTEFFSDTDEPETLAGRLLFSALSAAALAKTTDEPSDHEHGQQESDDHICADEHINENDSGAILYDRGARKRFASIPLYGQSSGSVPRFMHPAMRCLEETGLALLPQSGCPDRRPDWATFSPVF